MKVTKPAMKMPEPTLKNRDPIVGRLSEFKLNLARALTLGLGHDDGHIVAKFCHQLKQFCFAHATELSVSVALLMERAEFLDIRVCSHFISVGLTSRQKKG